MFIRCEGGPCISRLERFPPRIEIRETSGLYVLVDDGRLEACMYQFVAAIDHERRLGLRRRAHSTSCPTVPTFRGSRAALEAEVNVVAPIQDIPPQYV
jgi:hypothetical protein